MEGDLEVADHSRSEHSYHSSTLASSPRDQKIVAVFDSNLEVADRGHSVHLYSPREPLSHQYYPSTPQKEVAEQELRTPESSAKTDHNPFGWSPLIFGLVVSLITAVVVGVAVGGGVGGALGSRSCSSSNSAQLTNSTTPTSSSLSGSSSLSQSSTSTAASAPTATLTDYSPPAIINIQSLHDPCNDVDRDNYTTARNQQFMYTCSNLWTGGDVGSIFAYALETCVEACSSLNYWADKNGVGNGLKTCEYVHFNSAIRGSYGDQYANCWLKSGSATILTTTGTPGRVGAMLVS